MYDHGLMFLLDLTSLSLEGWMQMQMVDFAFCEGNALM